VCCVETRNVVVGTFWVFEPRAFDWLTGLKYFTMYNWRNEQLENLFLQLLNKSSASLTPDNLLTRSFTGSDPESVEWTHPLCPRLILTLLSLLFIIRQLLRFSVRSSEVPLRFHLLPKVQQLQKHTQVYRLTWEPGKNILYYCLPACVIWFHKCLYTLSFKLCCRYLWRGIS